MLATLTSCVPIARDDPISSAAWCGCLHHKDVRSSSALGVVSPAGNIGSVASIIPTTGPVVP